MNDKTIALVTGASRGIGKAIAQQLATDGFFVVGTATSEKGATAISDYLKESGVGMTLDVTQTDSIQTVFSEINSIYGAPTVLVNNAGITRDNLMLRMKDDEWDDIISTNLSSIFRISKACLKGMMKNKKGRIVSIASVVGVTGNAGQAITQQLKQALLVLANH